MRKDTRRPRIFQSTDGKEAKAMERKETTKMVEYAIEKLYQLKIQAEFEDRQRGKKRYVSKVSAYKDLIKLLEDLYEGNDIRER